VIIKNKLFLTVTIGAVCVGSVILMRAFTPSPEELLKQGIAQRSQGNENAPIKIIEYFDYQCEACEHANKLLKDLIDMNPGKIYLQARFYPLPGHKNALKAAVFAECVSLQKDKFWPFHEEIFRNQATWAKDPYAQIRFASYSTSVGVDLKHLDACVADPEVEKRILEEKKKAAELSVKVTPSFFVNEKFVVGLDQLIQELKKLSESGVCELKLTNK
jgi:protein-disulfide isomerase